jgi:hypothetical protein
MKWRRGFIGILPALGVVSTLSAQVPAPDSTSEGAARTAEVVSVLESYYQALSDRDWPRFANHFWPGATIGTVWQPPDEPAPRVDLQSVQTFIDRAPEGPGSKPIFEERMIGSEVHVQGTLALVYARYRARFGDPGNVLEWEGLDAFILLEHLGEWRITALTFAPDS